MSLNPETAYLAGGFAVWAASEEAAFVHNRVVWAAWDVGELAGSAERERMEADETYLRIGVVGLDLGNRARGF